MGVREDNVGKEHKEMAVNLTKYMDSVLDNDCKVLVKTALNLHIT